MGELLGGDKSLIKTKYLLTCAYKGQELERAHASLHAILGDAPEQTKEIQYHNTTIHKCLSLGLPIKTDRKSFYALMACHIEKYFSFLLACH